MLCPPLFAHAAPAHHPYRLLARQLVAAGVTVVRFDYEGTGDSAGDLSGPDVVDTWLESVRRAAELARSLAPGPLGLVGLRMGALLAAAAAGRADGADVLVLWDPSVSGRAFLRQQQALHAMRFGKGRADGVVEMPGILLDAAPAAAVAALRLTAEPPSARTLVLLRPDEPLDAVGWLGAGGAGAPGVQVERLNPGEQEGLLEVDPLASEVPWHGIGRVASWLGATLVAVAEAPPGTVPAPPSTPAPWVSTGPVLVDTGAGVEGTRTVVRERAVRLGPLELFGVETGPAGSPRGRSATRRDARRPGPVAVFLSSGADHRTGPSRLWVTLAR
ncbi:MAG: serine aminopeptidase domain-containing protein, partial [Acidimicrobiales bacterium]